MVIHIISIPHTITREDYNCCAYTMKVFNWIEMMKNDYEMIHYGVEGSTVECKKVDLYKEKDLIEYYGYNGNNKLFKFSCNDEPYTTFNKNLLKELIDRYKYGDCILLFFGIATEIAIDNFISHCKTLDFEPLIIEPGIGYLNPKYKYRAYESNTIMGEVQGKLNSQFPKFHNVIIPGYYNPKQFPKIKYDIFKNVYGYIGRVVDEKGISLAMNAVVKSRSNLIVAGQIPENSPYKDYMINMNFEDCLNYLEEDVECKIIYVGTLNVNERNILYRKVKAIIFMTMFMEPFGNVSIESLSCGCPVITSGMGCLNENVRDGVDGYHARDIGDMIWSMMNLDILNREKIAKDAYDRWSLVNIKPKFINFIQNVKRLHYCNDMSISCKPLKNIDEVYIGDKEWSINDPFKSYVIHAPGKVKIEGYDIKDYLLHIDYDPSINDSNLMDKSIDKLYIDSKIGKDIADKYIQHYKPSETIFIN